MNRVYVRLGSLALTSVMSCNAVSKPGLSGCREGGVPILLRERRMPRAPRVDLAGGGMSAVNTRLQVRASDVGHKESCRDS